MNPISLLTAAFGAIKEFFGFANKKTELNNTPEMKKRDECQKEIEADEQDAKDLAEGNTDKLRNRS